MKTKKVSDFESKYYIIEQPFNTFEKKKHFIFVVSLLI